MSGVADAFVVEPFVAPGARRVQPDRAAPLPLERRRKAPAGWPRAARRATARSHGARHAVGEPPVARAAGAAALAVAVGLTAAGLLRGRAARRRQDGAPPESGGLLAGAALLAASVLADSALEHYRGGFRNPGMYAPLLASGAALTVAAGQGRGRPWRGAGLVYGACVGVGAAGLGFHLFNITKRPGGFSWLNLFYAAPIGAPAALSLAGVLGLAARAWGRGRTRIFGVGLRRWLAGLAAAGLLGTTGEAALLHFRGAFQNPFMWLPVLLPPVGAGLLARAAAQAATARRPLTRFWLKLTAVLGLAGVGFHIFGVSRAMGGWRNWRQNLVDGPPVPAPPAFSALAVVGLSALNLPEREALA